MLEADSKISERIVKAKGHTYKQLFIYLPKDLVNDSQFPLKAEDPITIRVDHQGLRIDLISARAKDKER